MELELSNYRGLRNGVHYYRTTKKVMGIDCAVILTYNPATARKRAHALNRGIAKLQKDIMARWTSYKTRPSEVTRGILSMQKTSDYGSCLTITLQEGKIHFQENISEIEARKKRFGKSLIF